jgi:hypothetical protein
MKEKPIINNTLKGKFTKVDSFPFFEGVEMFTKKNEEAKEYLADIKLPNVSEMVFVKSDLSHLFPTGYELFAEKNARAKEMLSKAKFPEGFGSR